MAIFHLNAKVIGRSQGRSATGAAAYRAGCVLEDERTGLRFDYTRKRGCDGAEIITPANAPDWASDRAELWNKVEGVEGRQDAQLCREVEFALPRELLPEEMKAAARAFAVEQFSGSGMIADLAFHNLSGANPHAHCLLTMRQIGSTGFGGKVREWNERNLCNVWRERWAFHANEALRQAGHEGRIDHRTLAEQALSASEAGDDIRACVLDRIPTLHIGGNPHIAEQNKSICAENSRSVQNWAEEKSPIAEIVSAVAPSASVSAAPKRKKRVGETDAQFRERMEQTKGLAAIQWRAADRRVLELEEWDVAHRDDEGRLYRARELAELGEANARADRRRWMANNPQPPWRWLFNRRERMQWRLDKEQMDKTVLDAKRQHRKAKELADTPAILRLNRVRLDHVRQLERARTQRRSLGMLPSEWATQSGIDRQRSGQLPTEFESDPNAHLPVDLDAVRRRPRMR